MFQFLDEIQDWTLSPHDLIVESILARIDSLPMIKKKELCNSTKAVKVQQKSDSLCPSKMMVMHQKGIGQPELKPHDSMVCGGERQTSTKIEGRPPWADGKRTASHSRIKPHSSKALNAFVSLVV